MALIQCEDCGKDVSTMAPACPNCGRPMEQPALVDKTMAAVLAGKRIACPDGNCTGIIKENCRCGTCGKHYLWGSTRKVETDDWVEILPGQRTPSQIKCPKCSSTQITAQKKGMGPVKALAGAVVFANPLGLLGGLVGAGKVKITCLACGHSWNAGS